MLMGNRFVIGFSVLLFGLLQREILASSVIIPKTSIQNVKIYGNKAEVIREFEVEKYDSGYFSILIEGLSSNMEDKSVRLGGFGDAEIVEMTTISQTIDRRNIPSVQSHLLFLNSLLSNYKRKLEDLKASKDRLTIKKVYVDDYTKNRILPNQKDSLVLQVDQFSEILDFVDKVFSESDAKLSVIEKSIVIVGDKLMDIQKAILELEQNGNYIPPNIDECPVDLTCDDFLKDAHSWPQYMTSKNLEIRVKSKLSYSDSKKPLKFWFTYVIGPAMWYPEYDVHIDVVESKSASNVFSLGIDYFAAVEQSTGESWDQVSVSLSTVSPSTVLQHPIATQRGVYLEQERLYADAPVRLAHKMSKSAFMNEEAGGIMMAESLSDMAIQSAVVVADGSLGMNYNFKVNHNTNISSTLHVRDNKQKSGPKKLLLHKLTMESNFFSFSVPSLAQQSYLRVWGVLPEESNIPILESKAVMTQTGSIGGARMFLEGSYIGESSISPVQPGGTLRLSLGIDKNMEIKYFPVLAKHGNKEEDKSTWFISDKTKYNVKTEEFVLSAKSSHKRPIIAILQENIPISTDDGIKVDLLSPDSAQIHILKKESLSDDDVLEEIFSESLNKDLTKLCIFYAKESGKVYWVQFLKPAEMLSALLKYKITWPDKKNIVIH